MRMGLAFPETQATGAIVTIVTGSVPGCLNGSLLPLGSRGPTQGGPGWTHTNLSPSSSLLLYHLHL